MPVTVFATSAYARAAKRLLAEEERQAMETSIAANPEAHPVIPGSGGLRKARWRGSGKGKSGGIRAIYFFWASTRELYLLFLYAKADQADLSAHDRKVARQFIQGLKKNASQNEADQ